MTPLQWSLIIAQINACTVKMNDRKTPHTRKQWKAAVDAWKDIFNRVEDTYMTNIIHFPTPQRKPEFVELSKENDPVHLAIMDLLAIDEATKRLQKAPAGVLNQISFGTLPAHVEVKAISERLRHISNYMHQFHAFEAYKNHPLVTFGEKQP